MKTYFERHTPHPTQFRGLICQGDANHSNILKDGYSITVFYRGRERPDWYRADSDAGVIETTSAVTYKGHVEIKLSKCNGTSAKT